MEDKVNELKNEIDRWEREAKSKEENKEEGKEDKKSEVKVT